MDEATLVLNVMLYVLLPSCGIFSSHFGQCTTPRTNVLVFIIWPQWGQSNRCMSKDRVILV